MEQKERNTARYRHVGPGEGRAVRTPWAELVTRKVAGERTGGAYSLFEVAVAPGGGPPPHVQHREDECLYVLEGRFEFLTEGGPIEAGPGSLVYFPKGELHAYKNVGASGRAGCWSSRPREGRTSVSSRRWGSRSQTGHRRRRNRRTPGGSPR